MANRVINEILRQGQGRPRKYVLAALATGKVESGFRNLRYGDADSRGWRQERASLYKNPNNLRASVARFYREAAQLDRGQGAGRLAADVQRPAAQYRGRYADVMGSVKPLLQGGGGYTGGGGGVNSVTTPPGAVNVSQLLSTLTGAATRPRPTATPPPAPAFSAAPTTPQGYQPVQSSAAPERADYASALQTLTQAADQARAQSVTLGGQVGGGGGGGGGGTPGVVGELKEMFWNGPGALNVKNGTRVPKGYVSGHTDHVHVAGRQKAMVALGELAQSMGLSVRENPRFDPVDPVHTTGSYHYGRKVGGKTFRALDVSGDPRKEKRFARLVANAYGI